MSHKQSSSIDNQHKMGLSKLDLHVDATSWWHKTPAVLSLLGLVGLALWASHLQQHAVVSMHAYLFAFVTCLCVALGCLVFV
ncbi:MAG: hypothetical protein AAF320_04775, partial [Myxococcota bacterium]